MHKLDKTVGGNLLVFLIYTLCFHFFFNPSDRLSMSVAMYLIQVIVNLIFSIVNFVRGNIELGKAFLLSSGLVLVIGFSICSGSLILKWPD